MRPAPSERRTGSETAGATTSDPGADLEQPVDLLERHRAGADDEHVATLKSRQAM